MNDWQESTFYSHDGLTLFYRYRKPQRDTNDSLLLLHRGHEHSSRMMPMGDTLADGDYWCFAFDLRGHGHSGGTRAWAPNFDSWVKDLNSFVGHIQQQFGIDISDMLLVANSVSSTMALSWVLNYGANIKGCILAAPAFSIKLYIPLALPALRLLSRFTTNQFVTSYVRSSLLTRDEQAAKAYDEDELITKKIGVNVLVTLFEASKNCFKRLEDFETPVLLLTAGNDHIVHNKYHDEFIRRISSQDKQHIVLDDFRHAILFEKEQHKFIEPCKMFIARAFEHRPKQLPAVIPKAREHTQVEYKKLVEKGSKPKQLYYIAFRYLLSKVGKYSDGVKLGLDKGFDSGVMLDYVYQNQPSGDNILGRAIDRTFLNSVGWRGIRTRKKHLKETLQQLTHRLNEESIAPVILDVASGASRYLFELQAEADYPIELHLNDIDENSIDQAKKLATEFGSSSVDFTNHDVFSLAVERDTHSHPNIIIISGLFELYENNTQVHRVISHLFSLIQEGGYLVYTGQPWHPQIEMIGRLLNNRQGDRWIMRRRIQAEMDQLVTSVGFVKLNTASDEQGIFTVSCARKHLANAH